MAADRQPANEPAGRQQQAGRGRQMQSGGIKWLFTLAINSPRLERRTEGGTPRLPDPVKGSPSRAGRVPEPPSQPAVTLPGHSQAESLSQELR